MAAASFVPLAGFLEGPRLTDMDRSGAARILRELLALLPGVLVLGTVAVLAALPPARPADAGLGWLSSGLGAVLVGVAALSTLICLIDGLKRREVAALLESGAWAAVAGGAVSSLWDTGSIAFPMAGAAGLLATAALTRRSPPLRDAMTARLAAVAVLVLAESLAVAALVPSAGAWLAPFEPAALAAAAGLAVVASVPAGPTRRGAGLLVAAAAVGLLADRGGSLEPAVALASLVAAAIVGVLGRLEQPEVLPSEDEDRLPELAARLSDAVLRFDGGLALREWNRAAAELLGLDAGSIGVRAEDLLGVSLGDLGVDETTLVSRAAVGGLEIAMHRSGNGVTAVVSDPGARPEGERLAVELRATIEELLRARRTIDLQRTELERSATVDPLTGISSRGAIMERLRVEVAQARRYRHPLALALIDVDGFAEINRLHGQSGGDTILREVALRFRLRVREADAIGRCGSDSFIAIMPHTDAAGAATFADALRHRLGSRTMAVGDVEVPVTISIGVTSMDPGEDLEVDALLAQAQEALDSAQSAGGDRIALDRNHGLARLEDPHRDAV
jgi:diguanylate cyclase (GGDEF)-like protein